jgi:O-antigen/teichoic acid export membrane protein
MKDKNSHKQILKSTGVVGGSQILSILIGIVRTKVAAILLGPSGIGYIGILQSLIDLVRSLTGFGINFSSVKDISESKGTGDNFKIQRTITILRKIALYTGLIGTAITLLLCVPLSKYSFGDTTHSISIAIISIILLLTSISSGQLSILQGLRKINALAKATILGAVLGTSITLPLYFWLGNKGIVPGMVLTAASALLISWIYTKKEKIRSIEISVKETLKGGLDMIKLGFFIVITGFIASITMYIVRAFILRKTNIDTVGQFQASWMISKTYIGVILNAMLADYFPRLSSMNKDNISSNKLINEQLEMTLVIGIPMILTFFCFANPIIRILYSDSFHQSINLLQWNLAALFFTLISWPLGVMFLAKGKGIYSIINDSIWSIIFISIIYFGWNRLNFDVLGVSFFVASIINTFTIIFSVKNLGSFTFSNQNRKLIIYGLINIIFILSTLFLNNAYLKYAICIIAILVSYTYSILYLKNIIDFRLILKKYFKNES